MKHAPESLCRSIMSEPAAVLKPDDTIALALRIMVENRVPALPITAGDGRYIGILPRSRLIALAMPRVLWQDDSRHPFSRVQGGFLRDTLATLQERLDNAANDPVSRHLDPDIPVLSPDETLMDAMRYLHRQRNIVPVVDKGKLVGVVSVWDVLARIGRIR